MAHRLTQFVRLPVLLVLAAAAAFTASTFPAVQEHVHLGPKSPAGYGPICLLDAAPLAADADLWRLDHPRLIFPFELVAAGYTESELGSYAIVARVTCTAYTSRPCETDSTPFITASNQRTRPGVIALSRDLLSHYTPGAPFSYGDKIQLIGIGTFQVEDTMNPRYVRRADIWMPELENAWAWGRRTVLIGKHDRGLRRGDLASLMPLAAMHDGT